jgi:hypothetical protein
MALRTNHFISTRKITIFFFNLWLILTPYPSLHASPYIQIYDAGSGMYDPLENKDVKSIDQINEIKQNKKCMAWLYSFKLKRL